MEEKLLWQGSNTKEGSLPEKSLSNFGEKSYPYSVPCLDDKVSSSGGAVSKDPINVGGGKSLMGPKKASSPSFPPFRSLQQGRPGERDSIQENGIFFFPDAPSFLCRSIL